MDQAQPQLSRISKLFLDRDQLAPAAERERREAHAIVLSCGSDVRESYTLQLATLTAARIAVRCFPGAVRVVLPDDLASAPLLVWPQLRRTFGSALAGTLGPDNVHTSYPTDGLAHVVVFGNAPTPAQALRVTFDGWIAKVGPAHEIERLPEREYCPLAGILGGALSISELFMAFAEIRVDAGRRTISLSLWRPDLGSTDPDALGRQVEFLPARSWVLGLGHLGNAYLWSFATLPYEDPAATLFFLTDFDTVRPENTETGLVFRPENSGLLKTRVCAAWLESRGFSTRLIERPFDSSFRRRPEEPGLALCGFDSNRARRDLATAGFQRVVEGGLGGTTDNFDTINVHTLPNPIAASDLWPDVTSGDQAAQDALKARIARDNPAYAHLSADECGRVQLAGESIAVPFVGAAAAALVVAEAIRLFHDGPAYHQVKLSLSAIDNRNSRPARNYAAQDAAGLEWCRHARR